MSLVARIFSNLGLWISKLTKTGRIETSFWQDFWAPALVLSNKTMAFWQFWSSKQIACGYCNSSDRSCTHVLNCQLLWDRLYVVNIRLVSAICFYFSLKPRVLLHSLLLYYFSGVGLVAHRQWLILERFSTDGRKTNHKGSTIPKDELIKNTQCFYKRPFCVQQKQLYLRKLKTDRTITAKYMQAYY